MPTTQRRQPLLFFVLVFAMAIPIMVLGQFIPAVPGMPKNGPVTDLLLTFLPAAGAMILLTRHNGPGAVKALLRRAVDWKLVKKRWWLIIAGIMPTITLTTYLVTSQFGQSTESNTPIDWKFIPLLFAIFWIMAAGEELGWMGYVMQPLQERFGALGACVVFAVPWTAAHIPSILLSGKSWAYIGSTFIASMAMRVIWQWVHNSNSGSIFAVICMHASANVMGTYFLQAYDVPATVAVAVAIVVGTSAVTLTRRPRHGVTADHALGAA